ncbi:hypothetical protein LTR08_003093 [Meristemomyces frigidus]|nr:hypothetical protein LTR08_003093 [Meristemomyces frigidus]
MAPIRIALIGLSQSAKTSWAGDAHLPYLLSDRGRERYTIVALLNSTEQAARRAIEHYELGADVKSYGSPHDLAADPHVDLVMCATRVDVHYDTIRPSIEAGKDVFVEWPLAENAQRAAELAALAREKGGRTVVGLQTRVAPAIVKVKSLLESGVVGKVVSSEVTAATLYGGGDSISEGLAYFLDKKVGGNPVTIAFGHMIDFLHHTVGEYATAHSHLQIQRPQQSVVDADTRATLATVTSNVPDLVSVHGTLQPSPYVAEGASLLINFRTGPPFPGTLPFIWTIHGEKGEIRISSERGTFIGADASGFPVPIEVHDYATGEVHRVKWEWEEWQEALPIRARSIGKGYDLFYQGGVEGGGLVEFDAAVARHVLLDAMLWP